MSQIVRVIRQKRFIVGFVILFCLIVMSFFYTTVKTHYPFPHEKFMLDSHGKIVDQAPFSPSFRHPLGTDKQGNSVLLQIIEGAKYTMGMALLITLIQFTLSVFLGFILSFLHRKVYYPVFHFLNGTYYVPLTLWAYILLAPILVVFLWSFTPEEQVVIPIIVLSLIGIPSFSIQITEEIRRLHKREFIIVAETIGGGRWHIFKAHIIPFLRSKLVLLFTQQLVQILVLIVALAILNVYIGGAEQKIVYDKPMDSVHGDYEKYMNEKTAKSVLLSLHNEWGGMIAKNKGELQSHPWLMYDPALAFCITVIAVQMIASAFRRVFDQEDRLKKRRRRRKMEKNITTLKKEDFLFLQGGPTTM